MRYLNIVGHCHSEFPPIGWPACPIQLVRLFSCSSESDRTVLDQGRRNESIRVSMHYQVFTPAQDAETSIRVFDNRLQVFFKAGIDIDITRE